MLSAQPSDWAMDTEQPPLKCQQCGEPVWPNDPKRAVSRHDEETGEGAFTGVVHEGCWDAFAAVHGVESD